MRNGEVITIQTGEMATGHNDVRIRTGSIGSCVAIILYDPEARVGGMAHAMLPHMSSAQLQNMPSDREDSPRATGERPGVRPSAALFSGVKYIGEAIDRLIGEIEQQGGKEERLKAKLVGGARMFKILGDEKQSIGAQNIEAAHRYLAQRSIPIESEDTGGTIGRIAELDLASGIVEVSTKL